MIDFPSLLVTLLTVITTPCETEHSMNCHWLAAKFGNGQGTSFISIEQPDGRDLVVWANGNWRIYP